MFFFYFFKIGGIYGRLKENFMHDVLKFQPFGHGFFLNYCVCITCINGINLRCQFNNSGEIM